MEDFNAIEIETLNSENHDKIKKMISEKELITNFDKLFNLVGMQYMK
jgi:hypothetical protein